MKNLNDANAHSLSVRKQRIRFAALLFLTVAPFVLPANLRALDDGLAKTPPMGWNSWNKFSCNVSEELIRSVADAIATNGMKDVGYQYVVIDDCWQVSRDADGNIVADPQRFPSGIKALADYIHSKGLKFGLYSCAGTNTCGGRPGSLGHEIQDARSYAAWGVDYLKFDWCNHADETGQTAYTRMHEALEQAGRPIVFSLCEWGQNKPWLWAKDVGHLWRTTGDIADCWNCTNQWSYGWLRILDWQVGLEGFAGPGHWNDPDMLEVGNGGMTSTEYKSHFSLWCILAAPLIAGNDVRQMTPEIKKILTNKELIAVNQDPLGKQGARVRKDGESEVWSKQLKNGSRAVVLFNRGPDPVEITVKWEELGYASGVEAEVRDLWAGKKLGKFRGSFSSRVPSHDVVVINVMP